MISARTKPGYKVVRTGEAPGGARVDIWEADGGALCGYDLLAPGGDTLAHWLCGKSEATARKEALEELRARGLLLPGERVKWNKEEDAGGLSGTGEAAIRRR